MAFIGGLRTKSYKPDRFSQVSWITSGSGRATRQDRGGRRAKQASPNRPMGTPHRLVGIVGGMEKSVADAGLQGDNVASRHGRLMLDKGAVPGRATAAQEEGPWRCEC
jgi:hypothetical protein